MGAMLFHKGAIFYLQESNSFQLVSSLYYFHLIRKDRDKKKEPRRVISNIVAF